MPTEPVTSISELEKDFKIAELEEENKKLKSENAKLKDRIITDENFEEKLDNENKKLKEEIEDMKKMRDFFKEKGYKDGLNYNNIITDYNSRIVENCLKIIELYMSKIPLD